MMFIRFNFAILALVLNLASLSSFANQSAGSEQNAGSDTSVSSSTISIIGNSELPEVEVVLPWRVAEGSRRSDAELQMSEMPDAAKPVGLESHRRQVFFDKHQRLQPQGFNKP